MYDPEAIEAAMTSRGQYHSSVTSSEAPSFSNPSRFDSSSLVGSETSNYSRFSRDYSRSQHKSVTRPYQNLDMDTENVTPVKTRFEKYVNRFAVHDPRSSSPICRRESQDANEENAPQSTSNTSATPRVSVSEQIDKFGGKRHLNSPSIYNKNMQDLHKKNCSGEYSPVHQYHNEKQQKEAKLNSTGKAKAKLLSKQHQNIYRIRTNGSTSTATTSTNTSAMQEHRWQQQTSTPDTMKSFPGDLDSSRIATKTPPAFVSSTQRSTPRSSRKMVQLQGSNSKGQTTKDIDERDKLLEPATVSVLKEKLWDKEETLQVSIPPSFKYSSEADARAQRRHRLARSLSPDRPQYRNSQFNSRYYMAAIASHRLRRTGSLGGPSEQQQGREVQQDSQHQQNIEITRSSQDLNENSKAKHTASSLQWQRSENSPANRPLCPSPQFQQSHSERQRFGQPFTSLQSKETSPVDSSVRRETNYKCANETSAMPVDRSGRNEESETVSNLIAKLNAINRSNPAEALAQIDSILKSKSSMSPSENAAEDDIHNDNMRSNSYEDESDDETSVSSITNPTYSSGKILSPSANLETTYIAGNRLPRPNAVQNFQRSHVMRNEGQKKLERKNRPPPPGTIQVKDNVNKETEAQNNKGKLDQHLQQTTTFKGSSAADIAMKIRMWDEMSNSTGKKSISTGRKSFASVNDESEAITATTSELGSLITSVASESNDHPQQDPVFSPDNESETDLFDFQCGITNGSKIENQYDEHEERRRFSTAHKESSEIFRDKVSSSNYANKRHHPWDSHQKQQQSTPQSSSHATEYWTEKRTFQDQMQVPKNSSGTCGNKSGYNGSIACAVSDSFMGDKFKVDPKLLSFEDTFAPHANADRNENLDSFSSVEFDAAWKSLSRSAFDNEQVQVKTSKNTDKSLQLPQSNLTFSVRPKQETEQLSQISPTRCDSNEMGVRVNQDQSESQFSQEKGRSKLKFFNQQRTKSKSPGRRNIMQRFNRRKKDP